MTTLFRSAPCPGDYLAVTRGFCQRRFGPALRSDAARTGSAIFRRYHRSRACRVFLRHCLWLAASLFGTLGDRIGKYRLIALCTLASTVGTLAAACTTSLNGLVAARFLTGMTAAGVIPLAMAWIGDTVAYEHRQATLARFLAGQIIGLVSGQFIGGLFTDTLGWRWSFIFLAIIFAGVGWHVLQESRHNPHAKQVHTSHLSGSGMLAQVGAVFATPWARIVLAIVFVEGMLVFGPMAFVPSFLHDRFAIS